MPLAAPGPVGAQLAAVLEFAFQRVAKSPPSKPSDRRVRPSPADSTTVPGAPMSTVVAPKFENVARPSSGVVAATQIRFALFSVHGELATASLLEPSLPAATTNKVFGWAAIASRSKGDAPGPPSEALTTRAPSSAA